MTEKFDEKHVQETVAADEAVRGSVSDELPSDNADLLQRRLGNRQIQLIAIGGSIGTAVFVSINSGLYHGGPASLLIAYTLYSCFLGLINNCMAEMTVLHPVSGGFIRMAGHWVSQASPGFTIVLTT
jgi:yeast amino acid transporter